MVVDSNPPNPLVTSVLLTWSASRYVAMPHRYRWIRNGSGCCESHWVALGGFCEANSPGKKREKMRGANMKSRKH